MRQLTSYTIGIFLFTPSLERYIAEYRAHSPDRLLTSPASFDQVLEVARDWEKQGVEVFISRRGTGALLSQHVSTPVLFLPFSELDLIKHLQTRCAKGTTVLITVYNEESPEYALLGDLLGIRVLQGIYTSAEELDAVVGTAKGQGATLVVGGAATQRFARKYGVPFLELLPSRKQVFAILESARNVAQSNREKEALSHELACMMDSITDGLISIDTEGQILSLNNSALLLLKLDSKENALNSSILKYIEKNIVNDIHKGIKKRFEGVREIEGTPILLNVFPVESKNVIERIIISLRSSKDIIRQSGKMMSAITRGFVATYYLNDIIYVNNKMQYIIKLCEAYANTNSSVIISGETGTGKEMLAQGIHNKSKRRHSHFVSVNCAELPEQLLESELFGHAEGAFTGSRKGGKVGLFELAHKGTIFLDEIDSAPIFVQSKLLRVLQEKEIMQIGGTRKIPVDVKIIAASGSDLWSRVQNGTFRRDLFFRLSVMSIMIPPLRHRVDDIDALFPHFVVFFAKREGMDAPECTTRQCQLLKQYAWPGNVRQLRHFAERYVVHSAFINEPFEQLYAELIQIAPAQCEQASHAFVTRPAPSVECKTTFSTEEAKQIVNNPEKLQQLLEQVRYSKKEAARILRTSRSTLWRKLRRLDLNG